jgi:DNA-binding NarL/FixJ family response regulator
MDEDQKRKLIREDVDFVCLKRYDFSLKRVLERFPDGASDRIIAQALGITEAEVQEAYGRIIQKLKKNF